MKKMNVTLELDKTKTEVQVAELAFGFTIFEEGTQPTYTDKDYYVTSKDGYLADIFIGTDHPKLDTKGKKIISFSLPWEMETAVFVRILEDEAKTNKLKLEFVSELPAVPAHQINVMRETFEDMCAVLTRVGQPLLQFKKKKPAKVQHRWKKEIADKVFTIDNFDSQATVIWQKRQEMVIKKGAKLRREAPLNKDGSLGLGAKMGQKYRDDHQDAINNFKTTEDIVLKSVNEVGLLLYFGGTNGWLELKDENGKTIDEWTRID